MDLTLTSDYWDKQHFSDEFLRGEWSFHPAAKACLHNLLGAPSREEWFCKSYLEGRSGLRALGIGVGRCATELRILSQSGISQYDLYDVSPVALEGGRRHAQELGLESRANFICADIHKVDLPDNTYDVITFIASLHHIEDLEATLRRCARALKPGGILWAAEYIGPDYFDYPPEHTNLARSLWHAIDPALKKTWEPELRFPTVEEVIAADPTESVHSSDIPRAMRAAFENVEVIPTYGTFAFILFWGLNYDALYDTAAGREFVQNVMEIDAALIDSGRLPHYFAYLIARKPTRGEARAMKFGLDTKGRLYKAITSLRRKKRG